MLRFKSAKIYFCFAVFFLVAKPFIGFTMVNHLHSPVASNILVKSFTKRILEFSEKSSFNIKSIQRKLADPVTGFLLTLSLLLSILFPLFLGVGKLILQDIQLRLRKPQHIYLLNGNLII